MSSIEKEVKSQVSPGSIRYHLKDLLAHVHKSFAGIREKGLAKGLTFTEDIQKELLQKCFYEAATQFLVAQVKKSLLEKEQNYSKSVGLLAHVNGLKQRFTEDAKDSEGQVSIEAEERVEEKVREAMRQLRPESVKELLEKDFCVVQPFLSDYRAYDFLEDLTKQLTMMELEGRFQLQQTNLPVERKWRNDKVLTLNFGEIRQFEQLKNISKMIEHLSFLPFELNAKEQKLQLQITEQASISYFAADHSFVKMHHDSSLKQDTGVKLTALFVVNKEIGGNLRVRLEDSDGNQVGEVQGKSNALVLLKSRKLAYSLESSVGKVFVFVMKISGPNDQTM